MLSLTFLTFCQAQENTKDKSDFPVLKGSYLGQKFPGMTPELFAPEIMDAEHGYHFPVIFSPAYPSGVPNESAFTIFRSFT